MHHILIISFTGLNFVFLVNKFDASSMEKEADKLLDKAEHTSQLSMLAKANALRRAAKTKRDDIVKLDADIVSKQKSVI